MRATFGYRLIKLKPNSYDETESKPQTIHLFADVLLRVHADLGDADVVDAEASEDEGVR